MASPPYNIAQAEPAASDFISQFPTNEQDNRDVIESWLLAISTNLGKLRADAMPDSFNAGQDFITSITISGADTNGNASVIFRDELDVVQAELVWDESDDNLTLAMYQDDGVTRRSYLTLAGDTAFGATINGSNVILANSALATAITGTGALNAGSITSGFGSIDIGTDTLAAGNTTITGTGSFSGVLSALSSIELGHATDTTLARAAAGFISVEGKRVPSPGSQAQGDLLVRGTTEWERLGIGTTLQVPTVNSGATALEYVTPIFSKAFESAEQPITDNTEVSVAHGLGATPKLFFAVLRCKTAEFNYSVGDEVFLMTPLMAGGTGSNLANANIVANNTNIVAIINQNGMIIPNKTGSNGENLTVGSWRLVIRAWV